MTSIEFRSKDFIQFSGRVGSGLCRSKCRVCGQEADWPNDSIVHAADCPVPDLDPPDESNDD